jgi:DNA-binding GntR family transcriptional regulator
MLADHLLTQIASGTLPIGARLPSELELCDEHGMSRGTVRQALRCLEDVGMISRSRAGTTVTATQPLDDYHPSAGTPKEIMDLARSTKLWRPSTTEVVLDKRLARRLGVDSGSRWYLLAGPLVAKRDPTKILCWSEHYHRDLASQERFRRGNYNLKTVASATLEQVVTAEPMREDLAAALDAEPASAALVVRRTHRDAEGVVIKVSLHTHRGDRYKITTTFQGVSDLA